MENLDPDDQSKPGKLDSRKKIQAKNLSLRNKLPVLKRDNQSLVEEPEDSVNNSKTNKNYRLAEKSVSTSSLGNSNDVILTKKNDSLCDFRSPIKDNEMNESLADFKVKPTVLKSHKRLARKESSKSVVSKKRRNRDTSSNVNQPSIESSFFKPQTTVKTAFLCPLCFKSYKDSTTQHNHMKSCAAKNKISTDKLLDAVQLQEKQANERKAMGLLAAPPIQSKKTVSRKLISDKDPQLQLALALSMSLHEAQVIEEFEDAHLLAGEPCLPINAEMTEEHRKTLQNFGFTTNKPTTASTSGKSRKKRPTGPTALQIRTQEERDRLITVRIAEVLMGDEALTQAMLQNVEKVVKSEENVVLKSRLLKSYHCVEDRLWEKTQQRLSGQNLYSCKLVEVSPCKAKPEPEIKHTEPGLSELTAPNQERNNAPDTVTTNNTPSPIKLESAPTSAITDNKKTKTAAKKRRVDENSIENLSKDWRCMVGASYMSDVSVIVKGDHEISAHQVVFWARCYEIISDVTRHDPDAFWPRRDQILWPETEHLSAIAFLEYIYCGVIDRWVCVFDDPDMLAGVRALARKYRVKKLFAYLRDKSNELKLENIEISKTGSNLESNGSSGDDSSSLNSEEECSICSVETDINSVSTACNEMINLPEKNIKPLTLQERDKVSANSFVDCFSSTNDSFAMQIPTTSSTKTEQEKLLDKELSERGSTSVRTTLTDTTDVQSLMKSSLSPSKRDRDAVRDDNTHLKLMNNMLEEDRCISPDIFDDSIYANPCDLEHDTNCSDVDFGVLSTPSKNMRIERSDLKEKSDRASDIAGENESAKLEKSRIDCPFVSTRRRGKSSKAVSADFSTANLESDNFDQEKKVSGSFSKPKGDITMAIEKMHRLNAKTASESDSDCESIETFPIKKNKNPFRINLTDNSSSIEGIGKNDTRSVSENEIPSKRRNKLSIFEKKIQTDAAKNPAMYNLTTRKPTFDVSQKRGSSDSIKSRTSSSELQIAKFDQQEDKIEIEDRIEPSQRKSSRPDDTVETIFDLTQESSRESKLEEEEGEEARNTTIEDQDLSMFEKYRRKHRFNSIDKYRTALQNISLKSSVSSIKNTDEALSSDNSLSSNDELFDTSNKVKRNSFSSRYEYTDPNRSTSNVHRELSNTLLEGKKQIDISPQSLSSESEDGEQSALKLDDVELSDLEIELSDSSDQFDNGKSQRASTSKKKFNNSSLDDKHGIDSLCDVKLEDTEFTIMKNDFETEKTNISDQETDTECCIEPISNSKQYKTVDKVKRQSDVDEDKSSDIYNEETDTGEMEDKQSDQRRYSGYKKKVDIECKEIAKSQSSDKEICEISSLEFEISGILSPQSINIDSISNLTKEVDDLLDECRASSQIYRKSQMNMDECTSRATTLEPLASTSTSWMPSNDLDDINLLNEISDSEFDDMEFPVNQNSSKTNSANEKSTDVGEGGKTINKTTEENCYVLDSDSSENEGPIIHRTKISASISPANESKVIRKRSIQSRRQSITPEKSSRSSLRTLTSKSVSENIIKTNSKSGGNFILDDSFDREFAGVRTPPIQEQNTSSKNQTTPQQEVPSENVTPLANYSAMKTPELKKELQKYGLKPQKRHRAKQLLRYIYNELHPLVPVGDKNVASYSSESSSEDERPPPKRLNRSDSFEAINSRKNTDNVDPDCETLGSDNSDNPDPRDASNDNEDLENNDLYTLSQSGNSEGLENVFRKLLEVDKSLHNKVLAYEPLMLEELHATLKAQGLKCKLNALMDFLDEQCITFRTMANAKKSRTRRKASPKKNQSKQ